MHACVGAAILLVVGRQNKQNIERLSSTGLGLYLSSVILNRCSKNCQCNSDRYRDRNTADPSYGDKQMPQSRHFAISGKLCFLEWHQRFFASG